LRRHFLEVFDRIYVINLPERADRRKQIRRQLELAGLGLDDPCVDLVAAIRPENRGKWPSIGARGCFLSHLKVLRDASERGCESILILEDDMDFSQKFLNAGSSVLKEMSNNDWNFVHGGVEAGEGCPRLQALRHDQVIPLTHFVAFRGQETIGKIVPYLEAMSERDEGDPNGGPMHVDGAYNWFRKQNPEIASFVCTPRVAYQRPSRTDIHDLGISDRIPVVREIKNLSRAVLHGLKKIVLQR
jgi:hypothetical protein